MPWTGNEKLTSSSRPPIPAKWEFSINGGTPESSIVIGLSLRPPHFWKPPHGEASKALMRGLTQRRIEPSRESYGSLLNAYAKVGLEPGSIGIVVKILAVSLAHILETF